MKEKAKTSKESDNEESRSGRVADLKQGHYSDGHPLDEVHYLECKIILKSDRFTLLLPMLLACFVSMVVPTLLQETPIYDSLRESTLQIQEKLG